MPAPAVTPVSRAIDAALAAATAYHARRAKREATVPAIAVALSGGRDSMVLLDALAAARAGARRRAVGRPRPSRTLAARRRLGRVLRGRVRAARGPAVGASRARRSRRRRGPRGRGARRALRACSRRPMPTWSRSRTTPTTRRRRCCCNSCAARARTGSRRCRCCDRSTTGRARCARSSRCPVRRSMRTRAARGLEWIDDESNADTTLKRNFLRHEIAPRLARGVSGLSGHARARRRPPGGGGRIAGRARGASTRAMRRRRTRARPAPTLDRGRIRDARRARRRTARATCCAGSCASTACARRRPRGSTRCAAARAAPRPMRASGSRTTAPRSAFTAAASWSIAPAIAAVRAPWRGEAALALPHGTLEFAPAPARDSLRRALDRAPVVVRPRAGGERIRLAPRPAAAGGEAPACRPRTSRIGSATRCPLVWCGDALAAVPGHRRRRGLRGRRRANRGFDIRWHPRTAPAGPGATAKR